MSDLVKRLPEKVRQHTQFIYERASGINLSIWSEMANDFLSAADRIEALEAELARLRKFRAIVEEFAEHDDPSVKYPAREALEENNS